jgi:hypothetical protein
MSSSLIGMLFVEGFCEKALSGHKASSRRNTMDDYQEEVLESHAAEPDIAQWDEDATEL